MHEIRVSVTSPEAADHGVAELSGRRVDRLHHPEDGDLMLHIEPRRGRTAVVVGALRAITRVMTDETAASDGADHRAVRARGGSLSGGQRIRISLGVVSR
jgi:hypothetical protein